MIEQFVKLVRDYIALIDGLPGLYAREFLSQCAILLPQIYAAAQQLPDIELPNEESGDEPDEEGDQWHNDLTAAVEKRHSQRSTIVDPLGKLASLLGRFDLYREVFDPVFDTEALTSTLSNDLSEIYCDLKEHLAQFDKGDPQSQSEAVWEWTFGMQTHWGHHLVDALRPIHLLVHDHLAPDWKNERSDN